MRTRLTVGLLALAAIGLAILSFVSYAALRSYLSDRADQQLESAISPMVRTLLGPGGGTDEVGNVRGAAPPLGATPGLPPAGAPFQAQLGDGPDDPSDRAHLPPGTYGEVRTSSGKVLGHTTISYGEGDLPRPALGSSLVTSQGPDELHPFTTSARSGGASFRVVAISPPGATDQLVVALPLDELDSTLGRLRTIEILVSLGILALLGAGVWWVTRVGLSPIDRMTDTANAIAGGDLSQRVETADERTEVGRLGLAFNGMLSRIERAFDERRQSEERMRRFLADASHELRTPLASIRGYAELFRMGAAAEPDRLETAMRRIESEAERMGGLVSDLLTLARLDEVREGRREPVEVAAIVADAREDAIAAAPDREISFTAVGEGRVDGDGDQLRQLVGNLVSNAIRHTPAGTPIELSVRAAAKDMVIEVRDHGPGLPAGSGDQAFERFWRRDESRARQDGGSGLGLAIAAAITKAHGGRIEALIPADGGALFRVTLPGRGVSS